MTTAILGPGYEGQSKFPGVVFCFVFVLHKTVALAATKRSVAVSKVSICDTNMWLWTRLECVGVGNIVCVFERLLHFHNSVTVY